MVGQRSGAFDPAAYEAARRVLEQDRRRAQGEVAAVLAKRGRIVGVAAVAWAACSVALVLLNPDLLLVAEIGWALIVVWGVFFLVPPIMGRANLGELFAQYEQRLDDLEAARAPLPEPADMPDLAAALDLMEAPE